MKKIRFIFAIFIVVSFIALLGNSTVAQVVPNYCIFGANSVSLGPITKTSDGSVGSNGDINFGGGVQVVGVEGGGNFLGGANVVTDHITMNGNVTIKGGTKVNYDVNAGGYIVTGVNIIIGKSGNGNADAGDNITLIGGNRVYGNVDAGGNVALNHNTVHVYGNVTVAGSFSQKPLAKVDGTIAAPGVPAPPLAYTPVTLPPATTFASGGSDVTNPGPAGITLSPGLYGAFNVTGANTTVTLTAGDYYFDSFNYRSTYPALIFDVTGGKIRIYVTGDIGFRANAKITVIGGGAQDVFVETHGNFTTGGGTVWNGTVFAPFGEIHIAKTNKVTGAFYGLVVSSENDITITCDPFIPPPQVICPAYCIFGNTSVTLGPVTKTGGGSVGSNGDINFGGASQVGGVEGGGNFVGGTTVKADHITVNGFVNLGGGTHVTNDVNAGGYINTGTTVIIGSGGSGNAIAGGDVTLIGANKVYGNVDADGDATLTISTTHVFGNVTASGSIIGPGTVDGTNTSGGTPATPLAYTPITLPPATTFTSGGSDVTNPGSAGITLSPGSYGAFNISGAQTSFTFTAGNYYFDSFNYQSTYPALIFDVTGGKIRIYVTGDIGFRANANISVIGGGAQDVFVETHGNFTTGGGTVWNGTVFAPFGEIYIAKTNKVTGAIWGNVITTENDITFTCIGDCPFNVLPKTSNIPNMITPKSFSLAQNFPNPFNPATTIHYEISSKQFVSLKVFDILGREVAVLVNEEKSAGVYDVRFLANNLASGIYLYRIQAGNFIQTKKMSLLK